VTAGAARTRFELALVDIGGDAALEARYRERLPVVEIDGEEAFTYFVTPTGFAPASADGSSGRGTAAQAQSPAFVACGDRGR